MTRLSCAALAIALAVGLVGCDGEGREVHRKVHDAVQGAVHKIDDPAVRDTLTAAEGVARNLKDAVEAQRLEEERRAKTARPGCPIPDDRKAVVGVWDEIDHGWRSFVLADDCRAAWVKGRGEGDADVGTVVTWRDGDFQLRLDELLLGTRSFEVQALPHVVDGKVRMTINGAVLERVDDKPPIAAIAAITAAVAAAQKASADEARRHHHHGDD